MTIDEAIKHAEEVAERCKLETDWGMGNHFIDRSGVADVIECGKEHRQLAEWLRELKKFREQQPCEDCISRKDILNHQYTIDESEALGISTRNVVNVDDILNAKPVQPKSKTGQWFLLDECSNSGYYCSECHKKLVKEGWSDTVKKIKYCPNCGCRMVEPRESEDKE